MPEARPVFNPDIKAGTLLFSGQPNTGQVSASFGSTHTNSQFSGLVAADQRLWLGAGRLEYAQAMPSADFSASGTPVVFYDAAVATPLAIAPGPINASGHRVLGVLRARVVNSGWTTAGNINRFDAVFTSGLCVSNASGAPGFIVSFTPVVSG